MNSTVNIKLVSNEGSSHGLEYRINYQRAGKGINDEAKLLSFINAAVD